MMINHDKEDYFKQIQGNTHGFTLPETNSEFTPENTPSQKETSIPTIHFQVPC